MADSSSLEKFVGGLAADGQLQDQSVDFTVSEAAALRKLSNVLESPQEWILKAVQAGVAAGCSQISITIARTTTHVVWEGLAPVDSSDLRTALSQAARTQNPFLDELVIGLRALLGNCRFRFAGQGLLLAELDRSLVEHEVSVDTVKLEVDHPGETKLGFRSRSQIEAGAAQTQLLSHRCLFCPVPIRVDGRPVQRQEQRLLKRFNGPHYNRSPLPVIRVGLNKSGDSYALSAPALVHPKFSKRKWDNIPVINSVSAKASKGMLICWISIEEYKVQVKTKKSTRTEKRTRLASETGRIHWLRHGVVCQTGTLREFSSLGFALALDASDSPTDLSGLSLGEPPLDDQQSRTLLRALWEETGGLLGRKLKQKSAALAFPLLREIPARLFLSFGGLILALLPVGAYLTLIQSKQRTDFDIYLCIGALVTGTILGFLLVPDNPYTTHTEEAASSFKV